MFLKKLLKINNFFLFLTQEGRIHMSITIKETNLSFTSLSNRSKTTRIILHHAAATTCGASTIHQWHKNQGWSGIGYHFVVRKNGTIERGRPEHTQGAHASGSNFDSIGICFEGNFDVETMGAAQKNAGIELIKYLKNKYGISKVYGHRDVMATGCPGNKFPFNDIKNGVMSNPMSTGWIKDDKGWWYRNANGSFPKSCWLKLDTWYYFDNNGYAMCDEWFHYKNKWYYLGNDCRMVTGWDKINGYWYYMNTNGEMVTGWQKIGGNWYYFRKAKEGNRPDGSAVTGWMTDGNYKYYMLPKANEDKPECSAVTKWCRIENDWYYFAPDVSCQPVCSMMQNHWIVDGKKRYYVADDGKMLHDTVFRFGDKDYTFDSSGVVINVTEVKNSDIEE